jgi:acyl-CoA thioesterase-2
LPEDPLLHACVITYASDMSLLDSVLAPHAVRWDDGKLMVASLDHCMWFHREVRADQWLLYDMDSPIAHGGRGVARGLLFNESGELMISMVQEGLTRTIDRNEPKKEKS